MSASALFFGSIGTLAETSELQRRAFNLTFAAADLDWIWDRETYRRLLALPGGRERIARYAAATGDRVDAAALHAEKKHHFAQILETQGASTRPGVRELMAVARARGMRVALVTTTDPDQLDGLLAALSFSRDDFDWVGDRTRVEAAKPAPDIYDAALCALALPAGDVTALEDTPEGAEAARAAGLRTLGVPGLAAAGRTFPEGVETLEEIDPGAILADTAGPDDLPHAAE
ncbi:HAD-IA family hydrolase [Jannaschia marina]|uniref:HAD-IA family hydrolase n=1 Tax=Jannaschia marina TaxID=2741674 RepID=UPI0015C9A6F4|nr:HAD-IA family hydrolase [Jannaschia marina]